MLVMTVTVVLCDAVQYPLSWPYWKGQKNGFAAVDISKIPSTAMTCQLKLWSPYLYRSNFYCCSQKKNSLTFTILFARWTISMHA